MSSGLPVYHDCLPELAERLARHGSLGLVVLDVSTLQAVEDEYGSDAFEEVRQRVLRVLEELRGSDYRAGDLVALDQPQGSRVFLFLDPKRRRKQVFTTADVRAARLRLASTLAPSLARAGFPYLKNLSHVDVGGALALHNPLVHPARILERAFREAADDAARHRRDDALKQRERIQDLIAHQAVVTAFQPIQILKDRALLGYEALSRGARGTGLESAGQLFGAAEAHGLHVELDRLCRSRALLSAGRISSGARLFLNTLPTTIRDPEFRGRALIEFLDKAQVSPDRIVIEITEKLIIANYNLFSEAMAYFTELGMSFAVDDVGAGYSGLESIARLRPHFLKIDISLVRDVHHSLVNREMVKAILSLGRGISSTVIAEGIETREEAEALQDIGIDYGQGFYLARPELPPE